MCIQIRAYIPETIKSVGREAFHVYLDNDLLLTLTWPWTNIAEHPISITADMPTLKTPKLYFET